MAFGFLGIVGSRDSVILRNEGTCFRKSNIFQILLMFSRICLRNKFCCKFSKIILCRYAYVCIYWKICSNLDICPLTWGKDYACTEGWWRRDVFSPFIGHSVLYPLMAGCGCVWVPWPFQWRHIMRQSVSIHVDLEGFVGSIPKKNIKPPYVLPYVNDLQFSLIKGE